MNTITPQTRVATRQPVSQTGTANPTPGVGSQSESFTPTEKAVNVLTLTPSRRAPGATCTFGVNAKQTVQLSPVQMSDLPPILQELNKLPGMEMLGFVDLVPAVAEPAPGPPPKTLAEQIREAARPQTVFDTLDATNPANAFFTSDPEFMALGLDLRTPRDPADKESLTADQIDALFAISSATKDGRAFCENLLKADFHMQLSQESSSQLVYHAGKNQVSREIAGPLMEFAASQIEPESPGNQAKIERLYQMAYDGMRQRS